MHGKFVITSQLSGTNEHTKPSRFLLVCLQFLALKIVHRNMLTNVQKPSHMKLNALTFLHTDFVEFQRNAYFYMRLQILWKMSWLWNREFGHLSDDASIGPNLSITANTHTHLFNRPLSGTTQVVRYHKVKPIWTLLKQETASGSGISWAICKSAPRSRQITSPAPTTQFFTGGMPFLLPNQQHQSSENKLLN